MSLYLKVKTVVGMPANSPAASHHTDARDKWRNFCFGCRNEVKVAAKTEQLTYIVPVMFRHLFFCHGENVIMDVKSSVLLKASKVFECTFFDSI